MMISKAFGWILAVVCVLACGFFLLFPGWGGYDKEIAKKTACLSNIKQLAVAAEIYRQSNDGRFPAPTWNPQITSLVERHEFLSCPNVHLREGVHGYAMHLPLVGARYAKLPKPETTVLFFETDALGEGVVASLEARNCDRHRGKGSNVAYADTHAKFIPKDRDP